VVRVGVEQGLIGRQRGVEVSPVQMRSRLRKFGVDLLGLFLAAAAFPLAGWLVLRPLAER